MKRLFALFAFLLFTTSSFAAPQKLNLFIWSEYIDPKIITQFERENNCKVNLDLYEDAESMLAKMQGGGVSLYDVVVPPDHMVPAMVKLKLLAPLRHENIPNLKNLDTKFANPPLRQRQPIHRRLPMGHRRRLRPPDERPTAAQAHLGPFLRPQATTRLLRSY